MKPRPGIYFVEGPHGQVEVDANVNDTLAPLGIWDQLKPNPQHYHTVRAEALKRDEWACVACGKNCDLEMHHRRYIRWGCEEVGDMYTFCAECHDKQHGKRRTPPHPGGLRIFCPECQTPIQLEQEQEQEKEAS